ncbi:DHH family phosphoesterase [Weissella tructae]|uniref:Cyclic-di-AMP phosphodiesterase n=2 Tax=Weissella TaxID=46255 RepID=A0A075TXJ3_9LACO|nr:MULTISPECIES: DHH family phosphoesterase [Weissella]AIG65026.1 NrnA_1 protein [Weissella tructae]AIM62338.1 NrnA_1 protein [Weissella ceti]AIM63677.1 NrnA_1 protein [Weissella ceti]ELA07781.1 signal protein [Weissella ceti NC36]
MKTEKKKTELPLVFQNRKLTFVALLVALLGIIGVVLAFMISWIIGAVWVVIVLGALAIIFYTLKDVSEDTSNYISNLSYRVERGEQEATLQMPVGILLYNDKGYINWVNPCLQAWAGKDYLVGEQLDVVSPEMVKNIDKWIETRDKQANGDDLPLELFDKQFKMRVQTDIKAVYLFDVSENVELQQTLSDQQLMVGQVSVDNYAEVSERLNDTDASALRTFVTRSLTTWMAGHDIYTRRITADKYMLIGYQKGLNEAAEDKFTILDNVREATSAQNMPVTLSMGISYGDISIDKLATEAQSNLDLALGRGGDQVVIKSDDSDAQFFGGTTNPMAKRTRVRARVISQALGDLISHADQVFIMGHIRPDMDSFGAALGVRRIATMHNRPAWVVYDENDAAHSDIQLLLKEVKEEEGEDYAILSSSEAMAQLTSHSLLIMVDHSKPSITESTDVYDALEDNVVVIDHHRRGEEFPTQAQLVYVESYASSTAELVTELFEYQPNNVRGLTRIESTSLLAGIQIDTKSFTVSTGTRTFDAASYLRSVGADGRLIQKFMKESLESYRDRSHLIERVSLRDQAAVVIGEDDVKYDSVIAAQTADELMQLIGVHASYVITRRDDQTVAISARSDSTENVQVVMEKLGGGGHLNNAATQMQNISVEEAYTQLTAILDEQNKPSSDAE